MSQTALSLNWLGSGPRRPPTKPGMKVCPKCQLGSFDYAKGKKCPMCGYGKPKKGKAK